MTEQISNPVAPHVLIVGQNSAWSLESSYQRGLEALGCTVSSFDIGAAVAQNTRLGRLGRAFAGFVPVEQWIRKANRLLVLEVMRLQPQVLITIGNCPVQAGALAQIRAGSQTKLANVWPDTLLNLEASYLQCLTLYDVLGAYSQQAQAQFERLGARQVIWLPLGADPELHPRPARSAASGDGGGPNLVFVGGWRPEREAILSELTRFGLEIWGPLWDRRCRHNPAILKSWKGRALFGAEYAKVTGEAKIALNIIDPTNFPAPNMRFFEVPIVGGLQISSSCPEMEDQLRDGEHLFYYQDVAQLPDLIRRLLADDGLRERVALAGHQSVVENHTYTQRARQLLHNLNYTA